MENNEIGKNDSENKEQDKTAVEILREMQQEQKKMNKFKKYMWYALMLMLISCQILTAYAVFVTIRV